jgi:hypothetical protein
VTVQIHFSSDDGEEMEESWSSPDAFYSWALTAGLHGSYTVYEEDEDGDWLVTLKGRIEPEE